MPPQPMRPGAVGQESPASRPLHMLQSELLAAKAIWEQLGIRILRGYDAAYSIHKKTLKDMELEKKAALSNDALIFVMSILSVGMAGGLMGSVIAPWVEKAGSMAAKKIFRASVVAGVGTQALQTITDAGVKKLWETNVPGAPYKPVLPDPSKIDIDIRDRIASVFGPILEALDTMIAKANDIEAPEVVGQKILNGFREECKLLTDKPFQAQIPTIQEASNAAELAMWIAWANQRDWFQWDQVYKAMDAGWQRAFHSLSSAYPRYPAEYAREMNPVGDRLAILGRWLATLSVVRHPDPTNSDSNVLYTDLRKLRALRLDDATLPFRRLSGITMKWDSMNLHDRVAFLNKNSDVKPIYK